MVCLFLFPWNEIKVLKCKWTIFSYTAVYAHVYVINFEHLIIQSNEISVNTAQICTSASSWVNCERYSGLDSEEIRNTVKLT